MARIKQTVMQRDFSFMGIRPDFLEADDTDLKRASLRDAKNMRVLSSRAMEQRPGTFFRRNVDSLEKIVEIRGLDGTRFGLLPKANGYEIFDSTGDLVANRTSGAPWGTNLDLWVESFREYTLLGNEFGIYKLTQNASTGAWSTSAFSFEEGPGGELLQPYWVYEKDITLRPSGTTGNIRLNASEDLWTADHVGMRVRYNQREVLITARLSARVVEGTVIEELPPSFQLTVNNPAGFRPGDIVIGNDTNFQGLIMSISGNFLFVVTIDKFAGPDADNEESLSGPSTTAQVVGKTSIAPLASKIWDEPLFSNFRGWPRSATSAVGRLILLDLPGASDVIALSSARSITDFGVGAQDDDAIARSVGDNNPRWLHGINMGDVVLLSDRGTYIIPTRDNGILGPNTFTVVNVDATSSSEVKPVKVEDGVVFVEAGGESVCAALLDGNVYLKWSVREISRYHSHLIKSPVGLCGPALGSESSEKYVFVVNGDGTLAALSWLESIRDEKIGFVLWETEGQFKRVAPIFGSYWATVQRPGATPDGICLEEFSIDAFLDCTVERAGSADSENLQVNIGGVLEDLLVNSEPLEIDRPGVVALENSTITVYSDGWDVGDYAFLTGGQYVGAIPEFEGTRQMGLNFECVVQPWPVELIDSPRIGTLTARVLQMVVSVQDTLGFETTCNAYSAEIGAYRFGDDLSERPEPRTEVYRFSVFGNRDHPFLEIRRPRPGPFRILAIGQRVQA